MKYHISKETLKARNKAIAKALKGKPKSKEHRRNLSLSRVGMSEKSKTKGATMLGKHHTAEVKKRLGEMMVERLKTGWVPWHRTEACHYVGKRKLAWQYEPEGFPTRCGIYVPDFFVYDWHCFVEVKGCLIPRIMRKLADFREEYSQFKLVVYDGEDLKSLGIMI